MTNTPMDLLRTANPVRPELTDQERREAQLLLARILDAPPAQVPRARPRRAARRHSRVVAVAGAGVALAVAVLVAVASIDKGPGFAERAYAAITEPGLFHVVVRSRATVPDPEQLDRPGKVEEVLTESWYDIGRSPSYHNIQYRLRDGQRVGLLAEFAGDRSGTRSRIPGISGGTIRQDEQVARRYDPTAEFKQAYKRGKVHDQGETTLDGRRVRRLVIDDPPQPESGGVRVTNSRSTYFVDADTLYPVRYTSSATVSSPEGRQHISATMDYTTFQTLPRTQANLALLELGARP